jgi:hypothetical protein
VKKIEKKEKSNIDTSDLIPKEYLNDADAPTPAKSKVKDEEKSNIIDINSLTSEEKALAKRISNETNEWEGLTEDDLEDYSLAEDPYKLPESAAQAQHEKKFAFRWAVASSDRIDQLRAMEIPARWYICNGTQTPFLKKYIDPIHGGIKRHDQLLLFKPWWMHEAHQNAKMDVARAQDEAGSLKNKEHKSTNSAQWKAGREMKINSSRDEVMTTDMGE